jgi:hypothetical protein
MSNVAPAASVVTRVVLTLVGVPGGVPDGVGVGVVPAVMAKVSAPEVPPPGAGVTTVTATEFEVVRSAVLSEVRSWVALTNVVGRLAPPHWTMEEATNPLPFTVSVRPALPAAALAGDRLLATGTPAVTAKFTEPDVPPPGAGVNTVTGIARGAARSAAEMAARSCVALTNVVVRSAPFQRTTEEATKPLPFTVRLVAPAPARAALGERLLTTGTGALVDEDVDEPFTAIERLSPPALIWRLLAKVPAAVGRNRTVTT